MVDLPYDILEVMGVSRDQALFGRLNAGRSGGCYPLIWAEVQMPHRDSLPANLYLANAGLTLRLLDSPPALTIMALATKASRLAA